MRYRVRLVPNWRHAAIAACLAFTLAATACSITIPGTPVPAGSDPAVAPPETRCERVTSPSGVSGTVVVQEGAIGCTSALALIRRYYNDPGISRRGNTLAAEFDGWTCVSPGALTDQTEDVESRCERVGVTLVVVGDESNSGREADSSPPCTADAIQADVEREIVGEGFIRCHGDWAYVHWGLLGDSAALIHTVNGEWVIYTAFPTTICPDEARVAGVPEVELSSFPTCDSQSSEIPEGESGDLGLPTPITKPTCDGLGILVVYNAVIPGSYATEIGNALTAHPGSQYLRTDQSCPSLRHRSDQGTPIYTVYRPIGYTQSEVCAAVDRENSDAYGKWLDMKSDPTQIIAC